NNTQATINVGDRVPIISSEVTNSSSASATSTTLVRNITYTDTGIILKVTPRITRGGRIDLKISQDISEAEVNTTSNIDSPVTSQRLLTTTMSLRDGQTIVCGGLIREKLTDNLDSLPIISTIPFVRRLLGDTNISTDRTELLVLITANIVQEDTPLQKLVKGYQQSVDSLIEFTQESYKQRVRRFQHQGDLDKWFLE
ncbi:MAG: type II and III secretion system protein, partial [Lentisphaeria bacterium]|nr:type II and III secretion system protein [Lentisphaeria bacterium]